MRRPPRLARVAATTGLLLMLSACHSVDAPVVVAQARDQVIAAVQQQRPGLVVTDFAGYAGCRDTGAPGLRVTVTCLACDVNSQVLADELAATLWRSYLGPVENELELVVLGLPSSPPTATPAVVPSPPPSELTVLATAVISYTEPGRPAGFEAEQWR